MEINIFDLPLYVYLLCNYFIPLWCKNENNIFKYTFSLPVFFMMF